MSEINKSISQPVGLVISHSNHIKREAEREIHSRHRIFYLAFETLFFDARCDKHMHVPGDNIMEYRLHLFGQITEACQCSAIFMPRDDGTQKGVDDGGEGKVNPTDTNNQISIMCWT
jgi:hypothetical protein